jgi:hypothetical protein
MLWRTMFDEACRRTMVARLRRLQPDAPRRWGRMTAPQMVAHLSDQMRHALKDAPVSARPGYLRWSAVRYLSIYILPWPKGRIRGPSEAFLTKPASWEADVAALEDLLDRFVAVGPHQAWPDHALFGRMSGADWGVFVHKHFDHHLRQFGL